jgi:hypothetical protein
VTAVQWQGVPEEQVAEAAARAAAHLGNAPLTARRAGAVVVLLPAPASVDALYSAVVSELRSPRGAIGVGAECSSVADVPGPYEQAMLALAIRQGTDTPYGVTAYNTLGLYRIVGTRVSQETREFVREWLGALIDYDQAH